MSIDAYLEAMKERFVTDPVVTQFQVAQFITYMDPPRFARAMFTDDRQGYDCTHISGVVLGGTLPSAP